MPSLLQEVSIAGILYLLYYYYMYNFTWEFIVFDILIDKILM